MQFFCQHLFYSLLISNLIAFDLFLLDWSILNDLGLTIDELMPFVLTATPGDTKPRAYTRHLGFKYIFVDINLHFLKKCIFTCAKSQDPKFPEEGHSAVPNAEI